MPPRDAGGESGGAGSAGSGYDTSGGTSGGTSGYGPGSGSGYDTSDAYDSYDTYDSSDGSGPETASETETEPEAEAAAAAASSSGSEDDEAGASSPESSESEDLAPAGAAASDLEALNALRLDSSSSSSSSSSEEDEEEAETSSGSEGGSPEPESEGDLLRLAASSSSGEEDATSSGEEEEYATTSSGSEGEEGFVERLRATTGAGSDDPDLYEDPPEEPWRYGAPVSTAEADARLSDPWLTVHMHDTALTLDDLLWEGGLLSMEETLLQQVGSALDPIWACPRKVTLAKFAVWSEFRKRVRVPWWFRAGYRLVGGKVAEVHVCADPQGLRAALGDRWAGASLEALRRDPAFVDDLLRHGAAAGLTVHATIPKPLNMRERGLELVGKLEPVLASLRRKGYALSGNPGQIIRELDDVFDRHRLAAVDLVSSGWKTHWGVSVNTEELGWALKYNLREEDFLVDGYYLPGREARKHWRAVEREEDAARQLRAASAAAPAPEPSSDDGSSSGEYETTSGEEETSGSEDEASASASEGKGASIFGALDKPRQRPAKKKPAKGKGFGNPFAAVGERWGRFWGRRARRRMKVRSGKVGLKSVDEVMAELDGKPVIDLARVNWRRVLHFGDGRGMHREVLPHIPAGSEILLEWQSDDSLNVKGIAPLKGRDDFHWLGTVNRGTTARAVFELVFGEHAVVSRKQRDAVLAGAACVLKGYDAAAARAAPPSKLRLPRVTRKFKGPELAGRFEMYSLKYGSQCPGPALPSADGGASAIKQVVV